MRINPIHIYRQVQQTTLNRQTKTDPAAAAPVQDRQDALTLSEAAQGMAEAMKRAQEAPDVRQEKVAVLKQQLNQGAYRVDSRQTAESLLRHIGRNKE